jgi:hypothetical protein
MNNLTVGDLLPMTGRYLWSNDDEKTIWVVRDGDEMQIVTEWKSLSALFDANAAEAAEFSRTGKHGEFQKVASVPKGMFAEWRKDGITDDPEAMRRRLNDSDNRKFRVNSWSL